MKQEIVHAPTQPSQGGPRFVVPDPRPITPTRVEVLPPAAWEMSGAQPAQTQQQLVTSHVDRAKGFTIASVPLAAVLGLVAFLAAVVLFGVPWLSGLALIVLAGTFAAVWLVAWVWYQSASPDGVVLWQVILHYRLLRAEQRERLARLRRYQEDNHERH